MRSSECGTKEGVFRCAVGKEQDVPRPSGTQAVILSGVQQIRKIDGDVSERNDAPFGGSPVFLFSLPVFLDKV